MKDIDVLIPYGNETPWRRAALDYVTSWYEETLESTRIVKGFAAGPWCKALAVAEALRESRASVLVVADADCVAPGIREAVRAVQDGAPWAMPHLKVYRMNTAATGEIYQGASPGSLTGRNVWLDQNPYKGFEGGGVTVLRRDVYLDCPLDPAFVGWGQEDEAWALALNGLYGPPRRGVAPLFHLWHEKPDRMTRYAGSAASLERLARYREADSENAWDALLEDARKYARGDIQRCKVAI